MRPDLPILIVEDDVVDVITIKRAFKDVGLLNPLLHAANGEEALQVLSNPKGRLPGLIILDLNMPVMNGIEFLKTAKSDEALRAVPIVVLTTSKDDADKLESFKNGVAGYMVKPVDYNRFLDLVRIINAYWSESEVPNK